MGFGSQSPAWRSKSPGIPWVPPASRASFRSRPTCPQFRGPRLGPAGPRLSYLGPWEECGGWGFAAFRGGGFVVFRPGSFVSFAGRGFVAFADRGFVLFLGLFASLEFLVFLDFMLRNRSFQRPWGCSAIPVPGCDEQGAGWGGAVGAGGVRFLPSPSVPPCPPAIEELLHVLVELA